jgi:hypothetical protein
MHGTSLMVVERMARRVGPRTTGFLLLGLCLSGWIGFLVLAGVLLATRSAGTAEPVPMERKQVVATTTSAVQKDVPAPQPVAAPRPVVRDLSILARYEDRRRIQEWVQQWDTADHQDGNVGAARLVYEHAVRKGWAPAALALALTYDPLELQRRGVALAPDVGKARGCYAMARELMEATVAYYLSRLPPGAREEKC